MSFNLQVTSHDKSGRLTGRGVSLLRLLRRRSLRLRHVCVDDQAEHKIKKKNKTNTQRKTKEIQTSQASLGENIIKIVGLVNYGFPLFSARAEVVWKKRGIEIPIPTRPPSRQIHVVARDPVLGSLVVA